MTGVMMCIIMLYYAKTLVFEFPLDFEVVINYIIVRRGGLYDESRYHLRSF